MICGLIPGLHPNTLIPLLLLISPFFTNLEFALIMIGLLITTNFFEFIKTTYLSTPDEGDVLASTYVQSLLLKGRGKEAVKLLSIGAIGTILSLSVILPLIIKYIYVVNIFVRKFIVVSLIILCLQMLLKEKIKIGKAIIIFSLAGLLGVLTLKTEIINQPLLPLLAGFYGMSSLIKNIESQQDIPSQMKNIVILVENKTKLKGIIKALISSSIITFLPAIGPSQAAFISNELTKTKNKKEKLITIGGVNTGDILFSITALFSIHKARSGIIEQINLQLNNTNYLILILGTIISGLINYWLVNKLSYKFGEKISLINYSVLNSLLSIFIIIITFFVCGWKGLLILTTATLIGLLSKEYGVNPNNLMASLIVPTIFYYV